MIKIQSRNVRLAKMDMAAAKFLASNEREESILASIFTLFLSKRDRVLEGKDIAKIRREHKIAKSTMHKSVLRDITESCV